MVLACGLGLVIASSAQLAAEASHLQMAKKDAFDSILALTQARAVSYDANADESRYLVDPGRAAQYQQAFLSKSQQLADVGNVGIFQYDAALAAAVSAYQADHADVRFGGAIHVGQDDASGWTAVIPGAGALLVVILTFIGVRPRLAEYR